MSIWQTARFVATEHKTFGWIGRAMDQHTTSNSGSPHSILLGDEAPPIALRGRRSKSVALADLYDLQLTTGAKLLSKPVLSKQVQKSDSDLLAFARRAALDAHSTADLIDEAVKTTRAGTSSYPRTRLAGRLKSIARLIKSGFSTSVYYAIQPGYDTHSAQLSTHARLLGELSGAMKSFLDDMHQSGLADRVLMLCFSEFGRRVKENASRGTDHGTAGPVLIAGASVRPGLHGQSPSLTDLEHGDLKMQTDFRQIYATILEDWLRTPALCDLVGHRSCVEVTQPSRRGIQAQLSRIQPEDSSRGP